MLAVVQSEAGGPDVLRLGEVPEPRPGPGEVVVSVAAAGVNRADLLQRQGRYPPPPGASDILGLECSGTIVDTGDGVAGFSLGQPVVALLTGGGYAQRVAVPAGQVAPVPPGVDLIDAAGIPEVSATVVSNLGRVAPAIGVGLEPGERLLVHGGTSGVGTFALQWAQALGASVFTTVGSDSKGELARQLGAERAINYRQEDFAAVIEQETSGRGVDAILDIVGARYLRANLTSLGLGGRLVVIGLQGGIKGELDLAVLLSKRASITATGLRARPAGEKAAIVGHLRDTVWPMYADGRVRPVTAQVVDWREVADAHDMLAGGVAGGKVILRIS